VWAFPRVTGNSHDRVHFEDAPPQVPDKLLKRIILVASNPGDMVLDPQCGNGTTIKAALELGRRAQGIERSPLYASQALAWINGGGKKS
jgi:site-specific DNA-methyltransferase (adenine-specific)